VWGTNELQEKGMTSGKVTLMDVRDISRFLKGHSVRRAIMNRKVKDMYL